MADDYSHGNSKDYDVSDTTDVFLINLCQDWELAKYQFGTSIRTEKMLKACWAELDRRGIVPEPYGWTKPSVYENKEAIK